MTRILFIDDIRTPPLDMNCDIARTYDIAIRLLTENDYDIVYLDHDLADFDSFGQERTGYSIVKWLVERLMEGYPVPKKYEFLTSNPVGKTNMIGLINRYLL